MSLSLTTHDIVQFYIFKFWHAFLELETGPVTHENGLYKDKKKSWSTDSAGQKYNRRKDVRSTTLMLFNMLSKPWSPKKPQRVLGFSGAFLRHTHTHTNFSPAFTSAFVCVIIVFGRTQRLTQVEDNTANDHRTQWSPGDMPLPVHQQLHILDPAVVGIVKPLG